MVWDRTRAARKRSKSPSVSGRTNYHFKRTQAVVTIRNPDNTQTVVSSRLVLNDIHSKGLFIFSPVPIPIEQRVEISIRDPHPFHQNAIVRSCQQISYDQKILSNQQFQYRIAIEFEVATGQDRERIDAYCNVVQETCLRSF
ncbi:MAG: PilZ domain-containing protein [Bdellovibrio sp.]|nr:PilZ domain-containing protein [Bdellovibrio sp.]